MERISHNTIRPIQIVVSLPDSQSGHLGSNPGWAADLERAREAALGLDVGMMT